MFWKDGVYSSENLSISFGSMWKRHLIPIFFKEKPCFEFFLILVAHFQTQEIFIKVLLDDFSFLRGTIKEELACRYLSGRIPPGSIFYG